MTNELTTPHRSNRIEWIDVCKGLLIVFMIMGHTGSPLTKWIYTFHMPAFIFLSGYTAKHRESFPKFTAKKVKRLLIPYVICNICFILFYSCLSQNEIYLFFQNPFTVSLKDFFRYLATADLGGATWFLPVIFEIGLLYHLLHIVCTALKKPKAAPFMGILIGIGGFWLSDNNHWLPYMLDLSIYGLLYYSIGQLFAEKEVLQKRIPEKEMFILCIAVTYIFGILYPHLIMNWPTRAFTGIMEDVVCVICGIYVCYRVSLKITQAKIITKVTSFWGKHSMSIMIVHFAVFRLVFAGFYLIGMVNIEYLHNLTPTNTIPMEWLIVTILTLVLCSCGIVLIEHTKKKFFSKKWK